MALLNDNDTLFTFLKNIMIKRKRIYWKINEINLTRLPGQRLIRVKKYDRWGRSPHLNLNSNQSPKICNQTKTHSQIPTRKYQSLCFFFLASLAFPFDFFHQCLRWDLIASRRSPDRPCVSDLAVFLNRIQQPRCKRRPVRSNQPIEFAFRYRWRSFLFSFIFRFFNW